MLRATLALTLLLISPALGFHLKHPRLTDLEFLNITFEPIDNPDLGTSQRTTDLWALRGTIKNNSRYSIDFVSFDITLIGISNNGLRAVGTVTDVMTCNLSPGLKSIPSGETREFQTCLIDSNPTPQYHSDYAFYNLPKISPHSQRAFTWRVHSINGIPP